MDESLKIIRSSDPLRWILWIYPKDILQKKEKDVRAEAQWRIIFISRKLETI